MNRAVLMSFHPQHACNILNGEKETEIRTRFPLDYRGWVYMYITKDKKHTLQEMLDYTGAGVNRFELYESCNVKFELYEGYNIDIREMYVGQYNGKVVARFYVDNVEEVRFVGCSCETDSLGEVDLCEKSCLRFSEIYYYLKSKTGRAIHISQLEIFDKPKELSEFGKYGSYARKDIKCKNKDRGICNHGWGLKGYSGCEKARLTKAPKNYCYIEEKE